MPTAPETLKKRSEFLACAKGRRWSGPGLNLQARRRRDGEPADVLRVGYTCSRKVGNAVQRNRAKRRLRAVAAEALADAGHNGWDYVLIGKAGVTATRPFADLLADLVRGLGVIHGARRP